MSLADPPHVLAAPARISAAVTAAAAHAGNAQLLIAALLGIAVVVVLITVAKLHPFLSLIAGAAVLGLVANVGPAATITSFTTGVGTTVGSVGLLIAIGSMIGGLLAESGGADSLVQRVVQRVPDRALPWAMAGIAALIGLPMFFEIGVVLLVPIVLLASTRTKVPLMKLGIPALAGLSVLHGLVPPHPGPLAAIASLKADLGLTLLYGLIIAVPTVVIAGPIFGNWIGGRIQAVAPAALLPTDVREPVAVGAGRGRGSVTGGADSVPGTDDDESDGATAGRGERGPTVPAPRDGEQVDRLSTVDRQRRRPRFASALAVILLPIVLMLARAVAELTLPDGNGVRSALDVIGNPVVALLAGLVLGMFLLGFGTGRNRTEVSGIVANALPAISGILLIVAAGGGFKQVLVDAGVGKVIASWATGAHISALVLGWLVAVGIRLATGSATVATITAAGIVTDLAHGLGPSQVALLVLAVGAGSLFFSHVNDAGFWLVNQYFGLTVGKTIASWSVMETIISGCGLLGVLLLNLVV